MSNSEQFYATVISELLAGDIPFMIGGSYALMEHLHMKRAVKDLDIVCKPADAKRLLALARKRGFKTELTYKGWLGKIFNADHYIDIIFRTSNGRVEMEDSGFRHGIRTILFGLPITLLAPEEVMIHKMYVFSRDCYHGHDIYKLIHTLGATLDWTRVWRTMERDWQVLHAHTVLFDFVYPQDVIQIPEWIRQKIAEKEKQKIRTKVICRGNMLSLVDYPRKGSPKLHNHPLEK